MILPNLHKANLKGKTVFLRADLDVPLELKIQMSKFEVLDDTRLVAGFPTLEYLLKNCAKVIIGGHLRRPEKQYQISNIKSQISNELKSLSLEPVAEWLSKNLKSQIEETKINGFKSWKLSDNLFILENLRFYKGEGENDLEFARRLADLADIFVNDAFASSHRKHASIVGVPKFLPHFAGFHLQKEIEVLSGVLKNPKRPLVVIIGGAKIETKLPLVEKMHQIADYVLIGGKIADEVSVLIKVGHEKIKQRKSVLIIAEMNDNKTDITKKSAENFLQIINLAKTVVWNGPVGLTEIKNQKSRLASEAKRANIKNIQEKDSTYGTRILAEGIIKSGAYSIVGGGDSLEFLRKINLLNKFNFFSTGGGAMLTFLSGEKLPGIEALIR